MQSLRESFPRRRAAHATLAPCSWNPGYHQLAAVGVLFVLDMNWSRCKLWPSLRDPDCCVKVLHGHLRWWQLFLNKKGSRNGEKGCISFFPNAVPRPTRRVLDRAPQSAAPPGPPLSSALPLNSCILQLVMPQLQVGHNRARGCKQRFASQGRIHFQSGKLPDPANSEQDIIFLFVYIPVFYHQGCCLSRKY